MDLLKDFCTTNFKIFAFVKKIGIKLDGKSYGLGMKHYNSRGQDYLRVEGAKQSPENRTRGFRCVWLLTAVRNLAAPPTGSS